MSKRGKLIVLSRPSCLLSSNSWNNVINKSQKLREWKHTPSTWAKRKSIPTKKKIYEKKGKVIDKRQPYSDREMQGCVGRIGHQGSKRLCERCGKVFTCKWHKIHIFGEVIQQYLSKVTWRDRREGPSFLCDISCTKHSVFFCWNLNNEEDRRHLVFFLIPRKKKKDI